jgi:hypothetical protein
VKPDVKPRDVKHSNSSGKVPGTIHELRNSSGTTPELFRNYNTGTHPECRNCIGIILDLRNSAGTQPELFRISGTLPELVRNATGTGAIQLA